MTKQLVWIGTAVMTTLLALMLLWQFRLVVVYILFSLALAATVHPLFKRKTGQSKTMYLTLLISYLVALGGLGLLLVLSGGAALRDIQQLAQQVSVQNEWRQPIWLQGSSFQQFLDTRLPPPSELFAAIIGDQGQLVLPALLGFTQNIFSALSGIFVVLFLTLYWSMDQIHFERLWLSLLPSELRTKARNVLQTIESELGSYIRSEVVQSVLAGLVLGLGYWLLGSPYPALLALSGALSLLVPLVGVVMAVIPPLLLGLMNGVPLSLLTALFTLVVVVALKLWVKPRLSSRKQYNPMVTVIIIIALADAFGWLGIIVAPPLSAVCQILWSHLVSRRPVLTAATQVSELKERQAQVEVIIKEMNELPPLVISSMERLAHLLENAEPIVLAAAESAEPSKLFP